MTDDEILWVINHTEKPLVVLHSGDISVPRHPRIINMANQLTLAQSLSMVFFADHYRGIDSCLSIARCQSHKSATIKSVSSHWYKYRQCYTAPGFADVKAVTPKIQSHSAPSVCAASSPARASFCPLALPVRPDSLARSCSLKHLLQ